MKKEDYKIIVYSIGFSIVNKRLLWGDLIEEYVKKGIIDKEDDITDYTKNKIDSYVSEISNYTNDEFNNFVKNLLNYINKNFKQEDTYHLSFTVLNHFFGIHKFDEKFNNEGLIEILKKLHSDIMDNTKIEFVKLVSGGGTLSMIQELERKLKIGGKTIFKSFFHIN